jgi:hypothetical protein
MFWSKYIALGKSSFDMGSRILSSPSIFTTATAVLALLAFYLRGLLEGLAGVGEVGAEAVEVVGDGEDLDLGIGAGDLREG